MTLTESLCVAIGFVLSSVHCKVVGALVPPIHVSRACKQRSRTSLYALNVSTFCPNRSLPPHRSVRGPRPQQWLPAPLLRDLNDDEYGRPYLGSFDQYLRDPASVFPVITPPQDYNVTLAKQAIEAAAHVHRREKHQAQFTLPGCIAYNECDLPQGMCIHASMHARIQG